MVMSVQPPQNRDPIHWPNPARPHSIHRGLRLLDLLEVPAQVFLEPSRIGWPAAGSPPWVELK
jgi:hypothetical protein